jgi:hypothetical protein
MNFSTININGIHANTQVIYLEHSTDTSHLLTIKDELGHEILITIINGEINGVRENNSSKHK